jgi:hypothetical protein
MLGADLRSPDLAHEPYLRRIATHGRGNGVAVRMRRVLNSSRHAELSAGLPSPSAKPQ